MINHLVHQRYEVLEKIGEGPLFTVYKARDRVANRVVALKTLTADRVADPAFLEGFRAGTGMAGALNHPNIAHFYESGDEEGQVFGIFEFVRGIDLKERIRRIAPFTLSIAVDFVCAIVEGLQYAHSHGLVHGDLRPQNVIISQEGAVKITDFGVALAIAASPRAGLDVLARSAFYHAPELSLRSPGTVGGDIYAVGAMLFEMLTGAPPYAGNSPEAIADSHAFAPIPSPRTLNPGVPRSIEGVVMKCLLKKPGQRYMSAAELLQDLKSVRDALRFGKPLSWSPIDIEKIAAESAAEAASEAAARRANSATPGAATRGGSGVGAAAAAAGTLTGLTGVAGAAAGTAGLAATASGMAAGVTAAGVAAASALGASGATRAASAVPALEDELATVRAVPRAPATIVSPSSSRSLEPVAEVAASSRGETMPANNRLRAQDDRISVYIKVALSTVTIVILLCLFGLFAIYSQRWIAPPQESVPSLTGKSIEEVRKLAGQLKVNLIEHAQYTDKPRNLVYRTDLERGAKVRQNRYINVWYSKGPTYVNVPNLVGMDKDEAESKLKASGLTLGRVTTEYNAKIGSGSVVRQNVSFKKRVMHDTAVDLVVSDGPKPDYADTSSNDDNPPSTPDTTPPDTATTDATGPDAAATTANPADANPNGGANDTDPNGDFVSHTFDRSIRIPTDKRGRRTVKVEMTDASGLPVTVVDGETYGEGDKIPLHFDYQGHKITLKVYYNDKLEKQFTFDPIATKNQRIR